MSAYSRDKSLDVKLRRVVPRKTNERTATKGFWERKFVEFCKRTDLHGFKYIVMEGLSSVERSCWALAVLLSIIFAVYFVLTAYKWYARNPIVTLFGTHDAEHLSSGGLEFALEFQWLFQPLSVSTSVLKFQRLSEPHDNQHLDSDGLESVLESQRLSEPHDNQHLSSDGLESVPAAPQSRMKIREKEVLVCFCYKPIYDLLSPILWWKRRFYDYCYLCCDIACVQECKVIESTQAAIWDIPFPAVTICDLNTISKKSARNFADKMMLPPNVTADFVFEAVRFAPLLHSPYISSPTQKEQLKTLQKVLDLNKVPLDKMFRDLSPASVSCTQLLRRCMWKNTIYRCDQLFQQVMTMYKLCCAFNYYAVIADSNRQYQQEQLVKHSEPRRVASCGYQTALTVLLRTDPEDYYSALVPSQGALVFIDSAYNIPNQDSPTRLVNPSTEVLIALSPERTYSTSGIRSFSYDQRQCYYSDEVKIGEFRQYSLHNCMAFQRIETIKRVCECMPYYFPIKEYPRICNFEDLECLERTLRPKEDDPMFYKKGPGSPVTCLPECEHYDYPIEVAMGRLATNMKLTGLDFFNNVELGNQSLLNVFFNDLVSTRFRRDVYFNWQNFTAAFGGLLSLMLGFTLIAGFDLVLFFTLRLVCDFLPGRNRPSSNHTIEDNEKRVNNWMETSNHIQRFPEKDSRLWKPRKTFVHKY